MCGRSGGDQLEELIIVAIIVLFAAAFFSILQIIQRGGHPDEWSRAERRRNNLIMWPLMASIVGLMGLLVRIR